MAAKPYLEGKTWSFRLRIKGQEIYRKGFATAAKASKEAERLRQKILSAGKPKHNGPWRTTLGQALQAYARERLPFMKGAEQEACRINRYLRACGLNIVKVTPASAEEALQTQQIGDFLSGADEIGLKRVLPANCDLKKPLPVSSFDAFFIAFALL